ncbi:hypothetical protein [Brevundimonas sp.]
MAQRLITVGRSPEAERLMGGASIAASVRAGGAMGCVAEAN